MATAVFACGWECGQIAGTAHLPDAVMGTAPTISTSTVRTGSRSGRCNTSASLSAFGIQDLITKTNRVLVARFYVRFATLPNSSVYIWNTQIAAGVRLGVAFNVTDSKLYPASATTIVFGATGASVTTGTWYRVDVYTNKTANPWTVDVQVDGVALTQHTHAAAAEDNNFVRIGIEQGTGSTTADLYLDDLLVSQTAGDYPLGVGYVYHYIPVSPDGAHNVAGANQFERGTLGTDIDNATTDSYLLIDEVPLDDATADANDYINMILPTNATDYVEHIFGPAPGIQAAATDPRAVEVIAGFHQAGTGTGNMRCAVNDGGTINDYISRTTIAGTTTLRYGRKCYATAPSTGTAWTAAKLNALRHRFGSPAAVDANPDQYLDCVMVEAEFVTAQVAATGVAYRRSLMGVGP